MGKNLFKLFNVLLIFIFFNLNCGGKRIYDNIVGLDVILKHNKYEYVQIHKRMPYNYESLSVFKKYKSLIWHKGTAEKTFVVKLPNCFVNKKGQLIYNGNIISESISAHDRFSKNLITVPSDKNIKFINGTVAVISTQPSHIYGHFLLNIITRLVLLEMSGLSYDYIYTPYDQLFMQEMLLLWGIDPLKIISSDSYPCLIAKDIIFASHTDVCVLDDKNMYECSYIPLHRFNINNIIDLFLIEKYRAFVHENNKEEFLPLEKLFFHFSPMMAIPYARSDILEYIRNKYISKLNSNNLRFSKKIFISRKDTSSRKVFNEDEVFAVFKDYGFERYELSRMSYLDQIGLFYNADIVVGLQGSGMLNAIYCRPGVKIIEIFQQFHCPDLYHITQALNLQYDYVNCVKKPRVLDYYTGNFADIGPVKDWARENL